MSRILAFLILPVFCIRGQTTGTLSPVLELNVSEGRGYSYTLRAGAMLNARHKLTAGPTIVLRTNPFRELNYFGMWLDYSFYFRPVAPRKLNYFVSASFQWQLQNHTAGLPNQPYPYTEHSIFNTIGTGTSFRLFRPLWLSVNIAWITCYYHDDPGLQYYLPHWGEMPVNPVFRVNASPAFQLNAALSCLLGGKP
jgi:hypothetical protein